MLGEGIVMFALKRIADAERDGDHVYAVIRGVGASSDGRGTAIYAPLPAGQVRALRRAYESAGYGPETVELVEAHGTGTGAGDAAEFTALGEVFGAGGRPDRPWCALGSVKSQIGHTKAAAGAAGMLKAVLALQHKVLPPTIKVDRPNPALGLEDSPFYLNTATRPWVRPAGEGAHPRRASVSSFGFGGTNFHVALEEYVPAPGSSATPARRLPAAPTELILLSAPAPGALLDRARQLDLRRPLTDLARQTRHDFNREDHARLAIVARDADDLAAKVAAATARIEAGQPLAPQGQVHYAAGPPAPGLLGFLFPGQGAQYVGMGADLAVHLPVARAAWDRAARQEPGDLPLHQVVFPPPAFSDGGHAEADELLTATEWAQPALAVHSVALLAVLARLGLKPDCVAGHSFGELVALHAAGAFDADALIRLARSRGELMRDAAAVPGAMLAVTASRDQAEAAVAGLPDVWLANHNAPAQVVLAGTPQALDSVAASLAAEGITTVRLKAATGFHSPLVAPAAGPFADVLRQAGIRAPALDVYAGRDAHVYPPDPAEVRRGLAAQIAAPVQFVDVIEAMYARGVQDLRGSRGGHGAVRPGRPDPRRARARRGQPRPQAAARRHQPPGGTRATVRPRDLPRLRRALGGAAHRPRTARRRCPARRRSRSTAATTPGPTRLRAGRPRCRRRIPRQAHRPRHRNRHPHRRSPARRPRPSNRAWQARRSRHLSRQHSRPGCRPGMARRPAGWRRRDRRASRPRPRRLPRVTGPRNGSALSGRPRSRPPRPTPSSSAP